MTPDMQRIVTVAEVEKLERENAELREVLRDVVGNMDPGCSDTIVLARRAWALLDGK